MKKLITIILFLLFSSPANSAVTLTGASATDGGTFSISGSFEAEATPAPIIFDDFSGGTIGQVIAGDWAYHAEDETFDIPKYNDNDPRSPGTQFIRNTFDTKNSSHFYPTGQTTSLPTFYMSCYMRVIKEAGTVGVLHNYKYVYVTDSATDFSGSSTRACYQGNVGTYYLTILNEGPSGDQDIYGIDSPDNDGWIRIEFRGTESSGGSNADGQVWFERQVSDGGVMSTPLGDGAAITRDAVHWVNAHFGLYQADRDSVVYYHDYSDIYFSNTWKRVVFANNADLSLATVIETQVMDTRSTSVIAGDFVKGELDIESNVYAFVFDGDNTRNTIGQLVLFTPPSGSVKVSNTGTPNKSLNIGIPWKVGN